MSLHGLKLAATAGLVGGALLTAACANDGSGPSLQDAQLETVIPEGGSTGVDPHAPITVGFTHGVMAGMDQYMVLHRGDIAGPPVAGSWAWNPNRTQGVFTPAAVLQAQAEYTLHLGGSMRTESGGIMQLDAHAPHHGGQWATSDMMNEAMSGSRMMAGDHDMMGTGWLHANGSYGMVFTFTTR